MWPVISYQPDRLARGLAVLPAARLSVDNDMNGFVRSAIMSVLLVVLWEPGQLRAAGMVPETPILVLDEGLGEAGINVFNSEPHPALLHTSVEDVPQDTEPLLLLTPPVARVEPGATQRVRFILRSAAPLKTERLKRVVFEGIAPQDATGKAQVNLSVRQNIPAILRPAKLPIDREPWKHLVWLRQGSEIKVRNPSPYVVRLGHSVMLLPGGKEMDLGRTYVLPGEQLTLSGTAESSRSQLQVRLFPVTTYGFAIAHFDAPLVAD
ncbi:P pilus assembly chaperone PapD [Pseudomonas sp. LAIL14HWK12:I2]|nr:P pilus assembly chaperone PapD [Pseudomonas sp. LAIL14HWK12:I2]